MSGIFYSVALSRRAGNGPVWSSHTARFENCPVEAHINLSGFDAPNGERFEQFQPRFVYAYIETPLTPMLHLGPVAIPNADRLKDTTVWLTTDHLTFQLQTQNVTASAVGMIYDRRIESRYVPISAAATSIALDAFDLAVYDDDGEVVATHREVRLDGGKALQLEIIRDRLLARSEGRMRKALRVAPFDSELIPDGSAFRIDRSSGRPVLIESESAL